MTATKTEKSCDICIIGSGPAAHTAAIYTSRANLKTILFEGWMANGIAAGGQLTTTSDVENFPGFPEGITGSELCEHFKKQSIRFGTEVISETVVEVSKLNGEGEGDGHYMFRVYSGNTIVKCRAVIVATGAEARKLEFPGCNEYWNAGISACAVCDGAAPIFRNKPIVVVGGGDSAMEEALFLTKYASMVYIIHRRNEFRSSKIMQDRVFANDKIKIIWDSEVIQASGDRLLKNITVRNVQNSDTCVIDVNGLFFAIGHKPASDFIKDIVAVDEQGYIVTTPGTTHTSTEGIFAAGDVQDKKYRQAITAAGSGCMAALDAEHYVSNHHHE